MLNCKSGSLKADKLGNPCFKLTTVQEKKARPTSGSPSASPTGPRLPLASRTRPKARVSGSKSGWPPESWKPRFLSTELDWCPFWCCMPPLPWLLHRSPIIFGLNVGESKADPVDRLSLSSVAFHPCRLSDFCQDCRRLRKRSALQRQSKAPAPCKSPLHASKLSLGGLRLGYFETYCPYCGNRCFWYVGPCCFYFVWGFESLRLVHCQ